MYSLAWGAATGSFFPLFGDYDGDGKTDFVSRQTSAERITGTSFKALRKRTVPLISGNKATK
jgi:hypothetical protein